MKLKSIWYRLKNEELGAAALQMANPALQTVQRKPQSTSSPNQGGPFTRHSRQARLVGFDLTGQVFGGVIAQPLKPVPGYLRSLDLLVKATGGAGSSVTTAADGPDSVIQSLLFRDPYGQPALQCDGASLRFLNMYGSQCGFWITSDPHLLPSFSAVAAGSGNFTERFRIPIELISSDAYCDLPSLNATSQPSIQININSAALTYGVTVPSTPPVLEFRLDENFWAIPIDDPSLAPPGLGSSAQWSQVPSPITIGSAAGNLRVPLPRTGTWIHTIVLVLRDSTNARIDQFPDPVEFWIDGVPVFQEPLARRTDLMFEQFGLGVAAVGIARPTGVLVYSFRDSALQAASMADTGDFWLHTTPGTLLEFGGSAWGTITNAPAVLTEVTGEVYPVDDIPYSHLAA